jgi:hypothetical protein
MNTKIIAISAALLTMASLGFFATYGESQDQAAPKVFMRAKLDHSQKLLEALVMEDFDGLAKQSQNLSLLSLAASWQVIQTPEYAQQSLEFRRAADAVHNNAEKKNIDGAALAYVQMTMKCVNCHKYVRGVRMAKAEGQESYRLTRAESFAGTNELTAGWHNDLFDSLRNRPFRYNRGGRG